jgi:hypothetical protein
MSSTPSKCYGANARWDPGAHRIVSGGSARWLTRADRNCTA